MPPAARPFVALLASLAPVSSVFHFVRLDVPDRVDILWDRDYDPDNPGDTSGTLFRLPNCPYCNMCGLTLVDKVHDPTRVADQPWSKRIEPNIRTRVEPANYANESQDGRVANEPFDCGMLVQPTKDFFKDTVKYAALAAPDNEDDDCTMFSCPVCLKDLPLQDGKRPAPKPLDILGPDGVVGTSAFRMTRCSEYWDTQGLLSTMIGIVLEEYAGVSVDFTECMDEGSCYLAVHGCTGWQETKCLEVVRTPEVASGAYAAGHKFYNDALPDSFATVELTVGAMKPINFEPLCKDDPSVEGCYALDWAAPMANDGGVVGFTTQDGIYTFGEIVTSAWDTDTIDLASWRGYTREVHLAYFDIPQTAIDNGVVSERPGCWTEAEIEAGNGPEIGNDLAAARFLRAHNYECVESWWIAPACWAAYGVNWKTKCAIVWNDDWQYVKDEIWVGMADMRVAMLMLGYDPFWSIIKQKEDYHYKALFAWWNADSQYYSVPGGPVRINLPEKKDAPNKLCTKAVYKPALDANTIVDSIVRKSAVDITLIKELLENRMASGWKYGTYYHYDYYEDGANNWYGKILEGLEGGTVEDEQLKFNFYQGLMRKNACLFLRNHESLWKEWLPAPGSCRQGDRYDSIAKACVPCEAGDYGALHVESGLMECRSCTPGTFQLAPGATQCDSCIAGDFAANSGQSLCETCGEGTYSSGAASECNDCPTGKYQSAEGADQCVICGPGTFTNSSQSTACHRCERGYFSSDPGKSQCLSCDERIAGSSTLATGTTSDADCGCDVGFYEHLQVSSEKKMCRKCLLGEVCETFGVHIPDLQAGFSAFGPDESGFSGNRVWKCLSIEDCPGGPPGQCPAGRDVTAIACATCRPGFYKYTSECLECHEAETLKIFFPTTPIVLGPLVVIFMHFKMQDPPQLWGSPNNGVMIAMYVALLHAQSISIIKKCDIVLPPSVAGPWAVFDQFNSLLDIFHPECAFPGTFEQTFAMSLAMPFVVLVVFCATYLLLWPLKQFLTTKFKPQDLVRRLFVLDADIVFNCFWAVINTFFMAMASSALALFRCYKHPTGDQSLQMAPEVLCYSEQWNSVLVLGVIGALVLCCIPFSLFVSVAWLAPQRFGDVRFQKRWKFVFSKFQLDAWWWGLVIICKGVIMNLALAITSDGLVQTYFLVVLFSVYNIMVLIRRPWRHQGMDVFDAVSNITLVMVAAVAAKFATASEYVDVFVTYTLLSISLFSIVHLVGALGMLLQLKIAEPTLVKESETFVEQLRTVFQVFLDTKTLPTLDFKNGVVEKSLSQWLMTLGANDRLTLEKTRTLLVTELVGHQVSRRVSGKRLIAASEEGNKVWDGASSSICDKHRKTIEYQKSKTASLALAFPTESKDSKPVAPAAEKMGENNMPVSVVISAKETSEEDLESC